MKKRQPAGIIAVTTIAILLACAVFPAHANPSFIESQQKQQYFAQNRAAVFNKPVNKACSTEDLIQALEHGKYTYQRRRAAQILGENEAKEAIPHLMNALKDPEEVVQKAVAEALAMIGDKTIVEELIANTQDSNPRVRQYSAYVLGLLGKRGVIEEKCQPVVEALQEIAGDADNLVRIDVIWALYQVGSSSSKDVFIQGLKDEEPIVRMHSATALGNIKTDEAAKALVDALEQESDDKVRGMIASSLGKHGSAYAVEALLAILPLEREPVRADIAVKLGEVKTPLAILALSDLMLSDPSPRVRARAAKSLLNAKDPSTIPALAAALKDRVAGVRIPASSALVHLADSSVVDDLIGALGDPDRRVANNAADALIRLGDLNAVHGLIELVDSPNRPMAELAIYVLEEITYKSFGPKPKKWKQWYKENFKTDSHARMESEARLPFPKTRDAR